MTRYVVWCGSFLGRVVISKRLDTVRQSSPVGARTFAHQPESHRGIATVGIALFAGEQAQPHTLAIGDVSAPHDLERAFVRAFGIDKVVRILGYLASYQSQHHSETLPLMS